MSYVPQDSGTKSVDHRFESHIGHHGDFPATVRPTLNVLSVVVLVCLLVCLSVRRIT